MKQDFSSELSSQTWLKNWLSQEMSLHGADIDAAKSFLSYGMNSVQAMMLVGDIEDCLGLRLSPTLVWDYPTIETLARYIAEKALASASPSSAPTGNSAQRPDDALNGSARRGTDDEPILAELANLTDDQIEALIKLHS
jgi:acyl carrier protein